MKELPIIDPADIKLGEKLGAGGFGTVHKAIYKGMVVAAKCIPLVNYQSARTEGRKLMTVKHENIVGLHGLSQTPPGAKSFHCIIVMEYAECGSLQHFLYSSTQKPYNLAMATSWLLQCAKAVEYLHGKQIIHRDLKPANMLLFNNGDILKVCDFGLARDIKTNKITLFFDWVIGNLLVSSSGTPPSSPFHDTMTMGVGTIYYMAPEVYSSTNYTEKCDVFSWGIIFWEVISRQSPYPQINGVASILAAIARGERPPFNETYLGEWPQKVQTLITQCWQQDPSKRPSMQEVVKQIHL